MHPTTLTQACYELLIQVPNLERFDDWDKASVLEHFVEEISSTQSLAQNTGCKAIDILDTSYALVALLDEQIPLRCPSLTGQWRSAIAQRLFAENRAGEVFFERLEDILTQPGRSEVVEIYAICLGFGFRGMHAEPANQTLLAIRRQVARYLELDGSQVSLTHTLHPAYPSHQMPRRRLPYLWPTTLAICLGIVSMASLRRGLDEKSKEILRRLPQVLEPVSRSQGR